jgi:hypothetical protein
MRARKPQARLAMLSNHQVFGEILRLNLAPLFSRRRCP